MNTGWLCPRCNVVHAPSVLRCECKATDKAPTVPGTTYDEWVREQKRKHTTLPCVHCGRVGAELCGRIYCPQRLAIDATWPHDDTPIRESERQAGERERIIAAMGEDMGK